MGLDADLRDFRDYAGRLDYLPVQTKDAFLGALKADINLEAQEGRTYYLQALILNVSAFAFLSNNEFYTSIGIPAPDTSILDNYTENGQNYVGNIPDELLADILQRAYDKTFLRFRPRIARTCKRFYRLLLPAMYQEITVPETSGQPALLHRTLQENSSLGLRCLTLNIHFRDYTEEDFQIVTEFTGYLTNVISVGILKDITTDDDTAKWNLVRSCLGRMKSLQYLSLSGQHRSGLDVLEVMKTLRGVTLQSLTLEYVEHWDADDWDQDLGNASISEFALDYWKGPYQSLAKVLKWPQNLKTFRLGYLGRHLDGFTLAQLRRLLEPHVGTLEKLEIGEICNPPNATVFDVTGFTALQELILMNSQTGSSPENAHRFVSPNLRRFQWNFGHKNRRLRWSNFTEEIWEWIQNFATVAAQRKSPECLIYINFRAGGPDFNDGNYPWDRMEELNKQFHQTGVVIEYTTPPMTRDEWIAWKNSFNGN